MKKEITLYQKNKLDKIQQWKTWVIERGASGYPEKYVEFGLIDGKKQTTFDIIKSGVNIGKSNETTAYEQACLEMEREATKQREDGYKDSIKEALEEQNINFNEPLPKELCFYKPKNSIEQDKINKLEKAKRLVCTVKRDGMCHIIRKTKRFGVEIYSRRMDIVTQKYPHLVSFFEKLPDNTILLGEMILNNNGKDNFNGVSQICRSDPEEAIKRQKELGLINYYIFDLAFYCGQNCLTSITYDKRLNKINDIKENLFGSNKYIMPVEVIEKSHENAMKEVKERNLEGLVLWDVGGLIKDGEAFTFNGKSYRPNVTFKSKPLFESDFIAKYDPENNIGEISNSGKNKGKMKNVFLYQLDENGNEVFISKCGGGFDEKTRDKYSNKKLYPLVFQIEFSEIMPKTGSLRFPVFIRERQDKKACECDLDIKIKNAMSQIIENIEE